jgi:hypothetical protein
LNITASLSDIRAEIDRREQLRDIRAEIARREQVRTEATRERRGGTAIIRAMAKLRAPRAQVETMLGDRIRTGKEIAAKIQVAETTAGYRDWLHLFAGWRNDTIAELNAAYEESDVALEFEEITATPEGSSPQVTFGYTKGAVATGIWKLEKMIERLQLALPGRDDRGV